MKLLITLIAAFILNFVNFSAFAQSVDIEAIKNIPVLHEGRVKPLDTFTRLTLREISGKESIDGLDSNMWFMETVFAPTKSYQRKIFKINNPSAITTLGLPAGQKHFNFIDIYKAFSASQDILQSLLSVEEESLDPNNKYLKDLYLRFTNYMGLSRSFSFLFKDFKLPTGDSYSYFDLKQIPESKAVPAPIQNFFQTIEDDASLSNLTIIHDTKSDLWNSPWQEMKNMNSVNLASWKNLYDSYTNINNTDFAKAASTLYVPQHKLKFNLEILQNQISFTHWAIALYLISFLSIFSYLIAKKEFLFELSTLSLYTGAFVHITMIIFRSIILSRPPVTNLYESILFVSITSVIVSTIYYLKTKKTIGVFLASTLGLILLFLSQGYERSGDNFGMIVAVLDTNFWLATHVLTISIGYGCALVTSAMAHYYLLKYSSSEKEENKKLHSNIHLTLLFSLFFVILGTILGGIWADQSWGRFWGWDPKENGALLICLWLLWIAHAKISKHFKELSYAFFTGLTSVIVILAWFGVNLLNVGLHSYGFSNDTVITIGLFSLIEFTLLTFLYVKAKGLFSSIKNESMVEELQQESV